MIIVLHLPLPPYLSLPTTIPIILRPLHLFFLFVSPPLPAPSFFLLLTLLYLCRHLRRSCNTAPLLALCYLHSFNLSPAT